MIKFDFNLLCDLNFYICKISGEPFQIINKNNLLSALSVYDSYFNSDEEILAALFRSLIIGHGFLNGNKRTAAMCLHINNVYLKCSQKEFIKITYEVAEGKLKDVKDIVNVLFYNVHTNNEEMKIIKNKYNKNSGNIEISSDIFNNSISSDIGALGEGIDDYDTLLDKQKIFNQIKRINPNADYKNYENKSIRQMLAILNNYKDGKNRLTNKLKISKYEPKTNKEYKISDIYLDKDSNDYMIKGLHLGFETEKEAEEYIKELNSDE